MSKQRVEIKPGDVCISSERCRNGWEDRLSLTRDAALRLSKRRQTKQTQAHKHESTKV